MTQLSDSPMLNAAETEALRARQKARNKVLGLILGFLVILFFSISIVKITTNQPQREAEGAEAAEHS
jgi:hypothetical protein